MGVGFRAREVLAGSYYRLDEPFRDLALDLTLELALDGLTRFFRERRIEAEGRIFAEGLAEGGGRGARAYGTITWKLFDERRIPYDLSFLGDDGKLYRLRGQRDFFVHDAIDSLTSLPASLYDEASTERARALLRFDPRSGLGPLLRSFRPRLRFPTLTAPGRSRE